MGRAVSKARSGESMRGSMPFPESGGSMGRAVSKAVSRRDVPYAMSGAESRPMSRSVSRAMSTVVSASQCQTGNETSHLKKMPNIALFFTPNDINDFLMGHSDNDFVKGILLDDGK